MDKDEIAVKKESISKIKAYITEIEYLCKDTELKLKIKELHEYVDRKFKDNRSEKEKLEDLIYDKMEDSKRYDRDLYAKYYMLYQDVKNDRIDVERARELCESFERISHFEKRVF